MIRVGRRKYFGAKYTDPSFPNFIPIFCLTKSSDYGELSPYCLKTEDGAILENDYQFSKVYNHIPYSKQKYSRYDTTVIWEHKAETHIDPLGNPNSNYWLWREKGRANPYPVRYPVGFNHRSECLYSLLDIGDNTYLEMDYIESRKMLYLPEYVKAVRQEPLFHSLVRKLEEGKNLLIIEVDGPHEESLNYYKEKYNVSDDFIQRDTMLATENNLNIMLNDPKHPFGHGYCLAWAMLSH